MLNTLVYLVFMKYLYLVRGKVRKGASRGKTLGFPTANILLHKKIPEGIYASIVTIKGEKHYAATFIGSAKTFEEKELKCESYILNFKQNIYGEWVSVKLLMKLRNNKKFLSAKLLVNQIKKDVLNTKKFFRMQVHSRSDISVPHPMWKLF